MLQLRNQGGRMAATAAAAWRVPPQAQGADEAHRRTLAVEAVQALLRQERFEGRRVVTALSTSQLCVKNIRLDPRGDDDLRPALLEEARQRFGFDVQADQLAHLDAGPVRQGAEVRHEIILMATPPATIQAHMRLLEDMGLTAERVEAEPIAMFRGFERYLRRAADEQAVSVVIDLGLGGTRVVVARGRQIVFIKNIEIGGRKLTEAVARQLNIGYEEACDLRLRMTRERPEASPGPAGGAASDGRVSWTIQDALRGEVEALAREVNLCLRYCSVTFRGLRPDRVTVIGGEANDAGVVRLLGEHLGVPCVVGQPLRGIDTSGVNLGSDRRGMLTEWAICVGLAARDADAPAWNPGPEPEAEQAAGLSDSDSAGPAPAELARN